MKLSEFFNHENIVLPINWDSSNDFESFVRQRLDSFLSLIDQLDSRPIADIIHEKPTRDRIKVCCDLLKKAIRHTLEGHPHDAYKCLDEAVRKVLPELNKQSKELKQIGPLTSTKDIMYRVRVTDKPTLSREELFHIPFELRHNIATQRYSIPGLPCLYLSGSIYTCWEEMGRPPFHNLQTAAFWIRANQKLKTLNLSNRPSSISKKLDSDKTQNESNEIDNDFISSHIVLWPLMAACSIAVKHRQGPYKPEYIIPQMLLQWITKNKDFDGVCYFSTHVNSTAWPPELACNYVFPAQNVSSTGRCSLLCKTFQMTEPCNWQLLNGILEVDLNSSSHIPKCNVEFIPGMSESYCCSEFGEIESKLNFLAFETSKINRREDGDPNLGSVLPGNSLIQKYVKKYYSPTSIQDLPIFLMKHPGAEAPGYSPQSLWDRKTISTPAAFKRMTPPLPPSSFLWVSSRVL